MPARHYPIIPPPVLAEASRKNVEDRLPLGQVAQELKLGVWTLRSQLTKAGYQIVTHPKRTNAQIEASRPVQKPAGWDSSMAARLLSAPLRVSA
jgi:hypothetical protein